MKCVYVDKGGFFEIMELTEEQYAQMIHIGETANGYKKFQFPEGVTSWGVKDGVLQTFGVPNPKYLEWIKNAVKRNKEMEEAFQNESNEEREAILKKLGFKPAFPLDLDKDEEK